MSKIRRVFIAISFLTFASSLAGYISYDVHSTLKRDAYFREQDENLAKGLPSFAGPYCFPDSHPQLLIKIVFLSLITFIVLALLKKPVWSLPFAILTFGMFPYWFLETQSTLALSSSYIAKGVNAYLIHAGLFDICTAFLSTSLVLGLLVFNVHTLILFLRRPRLP